MNHFKNWFAACRTAQYHKQAADKINDDYVAGVLRSIAGARKEICENIGGFITLADGKPEEDGTFGGTLRSIWTAFRAGLNGGDPMVVLIEAERAEDVIVNKFKDILPQTAGNPVSDVLHKYFAIVKSGHDRVLALRNAIKRSNLTTSKAKAARQPTWRLFCWLQ